MNVKFDKNYLIPGAFFLSAVYAVIVTLAIGEDLEDMIGWIATLALGWLVLSNLKEGSPREAVIQITVTTLIMVSICSWGILHLFFDVFAVMGLLAPHASLHHLRPQRGPQHPAAHYDDKRQVHTQHLTEQRLVIFLFIFHRLSILNSLLSIHTEAPP